MKTGRTRRGQTTGAGVAPPVQAAWERLVGCGVVVEIPTPPATMVEVPTNQTTLVDGPQPENTFHPPRVLFRDRKQVGH